MSLSIILFICCLVDERLPQGIDLSEIDTSFRELTTDITRSGHSAVFDGILDSNASLKVRRKMPQTDIFSIYLYLRSEMC